MNGVPKVFQTDDMALASYLTIELGVTPELEWKMASCFFHFPSSDRLYALVSEFEKGLGTTDPRQYSMTFAMLKKAMFSHADAPQGPWKRGRKAAAG